MATAKSLFSNKNLADLLNEFETRYRVTSAKNMKTERATLMELIWDKMREIHGSTLPVSQETAFKV
jgi:hypothetical protein